MVEPKREHFDDMEMKYGVAFVQDIRDRLAVCELKEVHFLELKQMNDDILPRYRAMARRLLKQYRAWKAGYAGERDGLERVYRAYEGIFLRQQLADALRLYVTANRDYHEMRRMYLDSLFGFGVPQRRAAAA